MMFRVVRNYRIRNIFMNRPILQAKEVKYKIHKKPETNIYLIRKQNNKIKRLNIF